LPHAAAEPSRARLAAHVAIGAVLLAAGRSRRFGPANKLLAPLRGEPLWWRMLDAVTASPARPIVIVVGHQQRRVRASLQRWRTARGHAAPRVVFNAAYRDGMASSLQAGLRALPATCDGALICLADMPAVSTSTLRRLCAAYRRDDDAVLPVINGQRGNPALLGRPLFAAVQAKLRGDQGARKLIAGAARVREVRGDAGCLRDIDTRRQCARIARHARRRGVFS
jgi:molybdenum cofactor cytidylyltransferase